MAKTKRKRRADPPDDDSSSDEREPSPAPLREWLYGAGAVLAMTYAAASEGDDRAILTMLGLTLLFGALLWDSRKKRLAPPRKVQPPEP